MTWQETSETVLVLLEAEAETRNPETCHPLRKAVSYAKGRSLYSEPPLGPPSFVHLPARNPAMTITIMVKPQYCRSSANWLIQRLSITGTSWIGGSNPRVAMEKTCFRGVDWYSYINAP